MERVHEVSKAKRKKAGYSDFAIFLPSLGIFERKTSTSNNTQRFGFERLLSVRGHLADAENDSIEFLMLRIESKSRKLSIYC
jgi:hypothetical protein